MIQSTDLRINNWTNHKNKNGSFDLQVEEILTLGINVIYKKGVWFIRYEEIEPIPLTEEWLLKFGFEKKTFKSQPFGGICNFIKKYNNLIQIVIIFHYGVFHLENEIMDSSIKSVHQLQNLYFALTGLELIDK